MVIHPTIAILKKWSTMGVYIRAAMVGWPSPSIGNQSHVLTMTGREWMGCWGLLGLSWTMDWIVPSSTLSTNKCKCSWKTRDVAQKNWVTLHVRSVHHGMFTPNTFLSEVKSAKSNRFHWWSKQYQRHCGAIVLWSTYIGVSWSPGFVVTNLLLDQ